MKLAYLILAHDKPGQLGKLLKALICPDVYILVHVDKKSDISQFKTRCNHYNNDENVFFCEKREQVTWGGFGMIKATVALIHMLFEKGIDADYVNLLSGKDYPITSNKGIFNFFSANYGKNYIICNDLYAKPMNDLDGGLYRTRYRFWVEKYGVKRSLKLYRIQKKLGLKRKFIKDISPYYGSQWWSLHRDCIKFLYEQCTNTNKIFRFYKNTYIPDESLFQTIIMNSIFKNTVVNENLRHIVWQSRRPKIMTKKDISEIINSGKLFTRKINFDHDKEVISLLNSYRNKEYADLS